VTSDASARLYAIVTGPELRYLVVERAPGGWVLRTFDIAGAEVAQRTDGDVHASREDAQLEAVRRHEDGLQGWWIVPDEVHDAAYFARCHKDAPPGERRRLLA
jgi:hypothetical protein